MKHIVYIKNLQFVFPNVKMYEHNVKKIVRNILYNFITEKYF